MDRNGNPAQRERVLTRLRVARYHRNKKQKMSINPASNTEELIHQTSTPRETFFITAENLRVERENDHGIQSIEDQYASSDDTEEEDQNERNEQINYTQLNVRENQNDEERQIDEEEQNDEDEESDEDDNDEEYDEIHQLREWAQSAKIPFMHVDSLLSILRKRLLPSLPKTTKTFLKTASAEYNIQKLPDGSEFVFFGIAKYLLRVVNPRLHEMPILELLFNIDGLPIYKSSSKQFWPIFGKIHSEVYPYKPFIIAIYLGITKPSNIHLYLEDFIQELNHLMEDGIFIEQTRFEIRIKSFICDRPARSFIKCIIGHGGYYACERCNVRGERVERRTVYPKECEQRTNETFRRQDHLGHHTGISPLLAIHPPVDMVKQFSLDFMHLCCLGIMKKMFMDFWLNSKASTQISHTMRSLLSDALILLQSEIPDEFQRTTRSLNEIAKWKATEYRFFLLYCGPIVLKKVLPKRQYQNFLLFHSACRILCSDNLALRYAEHAKQFLQKFFISTRLLYGKQSQIMNVHSVLHLADDVTNTGCSLTHLTAFPFENALGKLKKMIRSDNRPLAQVCRRLFESFETEFQKATLPPEIMIINEKRKNNTDSISVKKLKYKEFIITTKSPNNTVLLNNGSILEIFDIHRVHNENTVTIKGKVLRIIDSIFTYPCNSVQFKMWQVRNTNKTKTYSLQEIDTKMVALSSRDGAQRKSYVISLLH